MDKYEYKTFVYDTQGLWGGVVNTSQFEKELNLLGHNGWELVSSFSTTQAAGQSKSVVCVFKRKML